MATTTRPAAAELATTKRKRPWFIELYGTALGKKYVMAITGIIGMLFIVGHMVGNLKLYLGGDHLDVYGEWLRTIGEPALPRTVFLWLLRGLLITAVVLHIHAAWSLTRLNHRADIKYTNRRDFIAANFASRTMRWTGILVGLFIVFHLADLTWGAANGDFIRGAVRHNMVHSFRRPPVAITYVVANVALGIHLWHGAWSLFQSMGWNNPRFNQWRSWFAWAFAGAIVLGNISFPILIVTHAVTY
ncbi:MAG: succinate dehydrogenase cytochrome b subunit [Acidobacteria bacterium]|nr:succinate dehydrogenase cytochrome b subunit [Acidobacteriota bacterium]